MNSAYAIHIFAIITLALGGWIFSQYILNDNNQDASPEHKGEQIADKQKLLSTQIPAAIPAMVSTESMVANEQYNPDDLGGDDQSGNNASQSSINVDVDPANVVNEYITAWQDKDKKKITVLWQKISNCKKCLLVLVDLIVNNKLEEGLLLEVAIKMAALDTDIVLPVFDVLIDPAGNRSTAIILSEKLIINGRPEFVSKIFEVIYRAKDSGYDNYARQLTWVISKLENQRGIEPILDTIVGKLPTSPEFSEHVTNVFSKVVGNLPESSNVGVILADYYLQANGQEQQRLWKVASQHGGALVTLALDADKSGQNYNVQKYAQAMSQLPNLQAVDSLMQLHVGVDYSPDYILGMLSDNVIKNPTIKVLHKLEDYMRNPEVKLESRIFAAEGLLAVRQNRQARYILEKVINNTVEPDAELQSYIGGRL